MYTIKNGKALRCGYTTGTCAAGAAQAAAAMLLSGRTVPAVSVSTPHGEVLHLDIEDIQRNENTVTCAIKKDAGDDPDMTDGLRVYAAVSLLGEGMTLSAGEGVGTITKPGLPCNVGEPAINPVPRRMIRQALESVAAKYDYHGGFAVTISIPGGEEIAKKTFNPRLGIVGGLSILGTSGIVDPMSEQALVDTIHVEMDSRRAAGERHVLAFFGNYGVDFSRDVLGLDVTKRITFSNYLGEMLDYAVYKGFSDVLIVGHIGKLVKAAQGIMDTHSHTADGRTTFLALAAVFAGASTAIAHQIYEASTTDEALRILKEEHLLEPVMQQTCEKIEYYLRQRVYGQIKIGVILFSNQYGILGYAGDAKELINHHQSPPS